MTVTHDPWNPPWLASERAITDLTDTAAPVIPAEKEPTPPMAMAHRTDALGYETSHAKERLDAAIAAKPGPGRAPHVAAVRSHINGGLDHAHRLVKIICLYYGPVGAEYDKLLQLMNGERKSPAPGDTMAHLAQTIQYQLAHASRHADAMEAHPKDFDFNAEHTTSHVDGAIEHLAKFRQNLIDSYPAEAQYLKDLQTKPMH